MQFGLVVIDGWKRLNHNFHIMATFWTKTKENNSHRTILVIIS